MNKALITNLVALACVLAGVLTPEFAGRSIVLQIGLFALSGALTNWLAVHMLFERVPLVYGSGVIPLRFAEFKSSIRNLIFDNFFTPGNFEQAVHNSNHLAEHIAARFDLNTIFDELLEVVEGSTLGSMLALVGGTAMLEGLRQPFLEEMEKKIPVWVERFEVGQILQEELGYTKLRPKIEAMVDARLAELTPTKVKEILDRIIRQHLGWLVVWGGVFGGVMGAISALLQSFLV